MRRYQPESPENYWYEIVEVFYGEDGRPMMWGEADLPMVSELDIDVEKDFTDNFDLETYIKQSLTEQFTMMMRDVDHRGPVMDERDFEEGGVYSNHPEALEMNRVTKIIESGDEEDDDDEDE